MLSTNKDRKYLDPIFSDTADTFRRLVENVHIGIYVADVKGNLLYVNHAFVDLLGYNIKDEVTGLNINKQLYAESKEAKKFLEQMEKAGFVKEYEVSYKKKSGEIVLLSVTSNYIRNEHEQVIGYEGIVHDISSQKDLKQSQRVLNKAVSATADNVMITDKDGIIEYVNLAFEGTTGYSKEEAIGKTPRILKSGKQPKSYYDELWKTILSGKNFKSQIVNKNKEGRLYIAEQTISPIKDGFGQITHFVSVWRDITDRKRLEEQLMAERRKLEDIIGFDEKVSAIRKFDLLVDFIVNKVTEIMEAKQCSLMLVDEHSGELHIRGAKGISDDIVKNTRVHLGNHLAGLVSLDHEAVLVTDLKKDERFEKSEIPEYLGNSFISVPIHIDGKLIGIITIAQKNTNEPEAGIFSKTDLKILCAIAREIAVAIENIKLYRELNYLAVTDPLTSIHNYRYFTRALDYEIRRTKRFSGHLALMMIDVDDFKFYNDKFGHPEGDRLLKMLGECLEKNSRDIDVVCRYAGDEFVVILPQTTLEGAVMIGERLREAVKQLGLKEKVTISIGLTQYCNDMGRHDLTAKADRALYQAKKEGKDKVCYYG